MPFVHHGAAALAGGAFCLAAAWRRFRGRRVMEDMPTSRVRSAAMGFVELSGLAKPLVPLSAPFTGRACVYWRCRVQEYRSSGRSGSWRTLRDKSSAAPFYLEDVTGRVAVLPHGASITALETPLAVNDASLEPYASALAAWHVWAPGKRLRIIEQVIETDRPIYVLGELARLSNAAEERRSRLLARLRALKADPARMAELDTDKNGEVDASEWDAARRREEDALIREPGEPAPFDTAVRKPADRPFVISTLLEDDARRRDTWAVPAFAGAGLALTALGFYLLRLEWTLPAVLSGAATAWAVWQRFRAANQGGVS